MSQSSSKNEMSITPMVQSRPARFTLEADVVLPPSTNLQFQECLTRLRYHRVIYHDWGFSEVDPMGRSIVLSLQGQPGTGKTLAAEALAGTLQRPFIHLGIAEVESSLLGATGRNIVAAFEAARQENAVLFFDEADTLLGKRLTTVTQGVDQEINAMRSTMFVELERFDGIVVFASNFAQIYDQAFLSRISYQIEFDLPDLDGRRALWGRMITSKIPLAEARETLIENCALNSDGLAGRDIRSCLRLSLPKALLAFNGDPTKAKLHFEHIFAAIQQVQTVRSSTSEAKPSSNRIDGIRALMNRSVNRGEQEDGIS